MKLSKEVWVANYKTVLAKMPSLKPSSGQACAIATVKTILDGLIDDNGDPAKANKDAKPEIKAAMQEFADTVRESLNELVQQIRKGEDDLAGFASNASAAAKAAGFKAASSTVEEFDL